MTKINMPYFPSGVVTDTTATDVYRRMEQILSDKMKGALTGEINNIRNAEWRSRALNMRMRWDRVPFEAFFTHYITAKEEVVLFIVYKDTAITLTDPAAMFPSDALITQLRLLTS
jgi:hypothetical protein